MGYRGSTIEYDYSQAPTIVGSFDHHLNYFAKLTKKLAPSTQPRVAEFGAGTGVYVRNLLEKNINAKGFDIAPNSMKLIPRDRRVLSIGELKTTKYEGVYVKDVLEHCPDLELIFSLFAQILVTSGVVMVAFRSIDVIEASLLNEVTSSQHKHYPISVNKVRDSAEVFGIKFTEQKSWKPLNKNEDWYYQLLNRKVLFGEKIT